MLFEFIPGPDFNFVTSFAEKLKIKVYGGTLIIPASLGEGKIRKIDLAPDFKFPIRKMKFMKPIVIWPVNWIQLA